MSLPTSDQNGSNGTAEDLYTLRYGGVRNGCCYKIEEWIPKEGNKRTEPEDLKIPMKESDILKWLEEPPPSNLDTGLRLLVVENPTELYPTFPMKKDTLEHLLDKWKFPPLDELSNALYGGGSAVFVSDNPKKISMA
jgi:hypothetical protein